MRYLLCILSVLTTSCGSTVERNSHYEAAGEAGLQDPVSSLPSSGGNPAVVSTGGAVAVGGSASGGVDEGTGGEVPGVGGVLSGGTGSGGEGVGGTGTGGSGIGGAALGGAPSGGTGSGGEGVGGSPSGGTGTGGDSTGGVSGDAGQAGALSGVGGDGTGGEGTGGTGTGGEGTGGEGTGGAAISGAGGEATGGSGTGGSTEPICIPGETICEDETVSICNEEGTAFDFLQTCVPDPDSEPGQCGTSRYCNVTYCHEFNRDNLPCDDGDLCTYDDTCSGGSCSGTPITCDDEPGVCGLNSECDGTDSCVETYPGTETSCTSGDPCITNVCDGAGSCGERFCWYDSTTGLMWQEPVVTGYDFQGALDYCDSLTLGPYGPGEWYLPDISELRTLVVGCPALEPGGACGVTPGCTDPICWTDVCECDVGCFLNPALDDARCSSNTLSASMETFSSPSRPWVLRFTSMISTTTATTTSNNVRCVRRY